MQKEFECLLSNTLLHCQRNQTASEQGVRYCRGGGARFCAPLPSPVYPPIIHPRAPTPPRRGGGNQRSQRHAYPRQHSAKTTPRQTKAHLCAVVVCEDVGAVLSSHVDEREPPACRRRGGGWIKRGVRTWKSPSRSPQSVWQCASLQCVSRQCNSKERVVCSSPLEVGLQASWSYELGCSLGEGVVCPSHLRREGVWVQKVSR